MTSRLKMQLAALDAASDAQARRDAISEQLGEAGDGLELAARCALGAWEARFPSEGEKEDISHDDFELGYRTAAGELALILRAMRCGEPPSQTELRNVFKELYEEQC